MHTDKTSALDASSSFRKAAVRTGDFPWESRGSMEAPAYMETGNWTITHSSVCSVSLSQRFTGANIVLRPFFLKTRAANGGADLCILAFVR